MFSAPPGAVYSRAGITREIYSSGDFGGSFVEQRQMIAKFNQLFSDIS